MKTKTFSIVSCLSLVLLTCLVGANASAQTAEMKIGVVDVQQVIYSSEEGKRVQAEIKKRVDELEVQAQKMQEEMQAMKDDFETQFEALTVEARNQKRDEMSKLERDYSRFVKDSQSEVRQIEQRALRQLLEEVGKLVTEYGKQENFTFILGTESLLYAADQIEVTNAVIELYNSKK